MGPALITPPAPISSPSGKFPFGQGQTGRLLGGGRWGQGWKSLGQMSPHLPAPLSPTDKRKGSPLPPLLPWADQPSWESPFLSNWITEAGPGPSLVWKMQLPEEYRKVEGPARRATRTAARAGRTPRTPQKLTNRKETPK